MRACANGKSEVVAFLVQKGADQSIENLVGFK